MKLTKLLWMAAAASMIFVACSKDETSGGAGGADVATDNSLKSVTVTIPNVSKAATRATGNAMAAGSQVSLTNYKVFFLNASGNVVDVPKFDDKEQQVYFDSDNSGWDANLGSGSAKTYHFLPATTSSVVVVGNLGDIAYGEIAESYDVLNDGDVSETEADGAGHPYYPLYGEDVLTLTGDQDEASHDNVYTASVTLAPQIARFEIYGFEYDPDASNNFTFTQIDLDRIALSNYYTAYDLTTGTAMGDPVAAPTEHTDVWTWIEELGNDGTGTQWFNTLYVPNGTTRLAVKPNGKIYVDGTSIPDTDLNGEGATGIVTFGIVDYSINNGTTDIVNPELLLSFYGDADGTATDLTPLYLRGTFNNAEEAFQAGKIYRVLFPIIDGAWEQPERCVELTITVAEWAVEVVTPEF